MIKKPEIIAYTKKIGALLILGLLFLIFANVRAVGPYDVSWGIDSFYSDTYNMQDLTFVWGGNTGNATNFEVTGCSAGNCFLILHMMTQETTLFLYMQKIVVARLFQILPLVVLMFKQNVRVRQDIPA